MRACVDYLEEEVEHATGIETALAKQRRMETSDDANVRTVRECEQQEKAGSLVEGWTTMSGWGNTR